MENVIYLDNAATTFPKPDEVLNYANEIYMSAGANANRGQNILSIKAGDVVKLTRDLLADWFGVKSNKVIFSPSATIALNQVILGSNVSPGGTIYASPFEHNSVLRPIKYLEDNKKVNIETLEIEQETLNFNISKIEKQFKLDPPEMIVLTHASNVTGLVSPVKEIASLAKKTNKNSIVIIDGAQSSCIDGLNDELIDYYVYSGHKALYGPYGVAGFILCSEKRPNTFILGGTGSSSESLYMPESLPDLYEAGSKNLWAIAGLKASLHWLNNIGKRNILNKQKEMLNYLLEELVNLEGVEVYCPKGEMTGVLSFNIKDMPPQSVENYLSTNNICVRAGLHCAPWAHSVLGTIDKGGTVRVSTGYFNEYEEIDYLMSCLSKLLK